ARRRERGVAGGLVQPALGPGLRPPARPAAAERKRPGSQPTDSAKPGAPGAFATTLDPDSRRGQGLLLALATNPAPARPGARRGAQTPDRHLLQVRRRA